MSCMLRVTIGSSSTSRIRLGEILFVSFGINDQSANPVCSPALHSPAKAGLPSVVLLAEEGAQWLCLLSIPPPCAVAGADIELRHPLRLIEVRAFERRRRFPIPMALQQPLCALVLRRGLLFRTMTHVE